MSLCNAAQPEPKPKPVPPAGEAKPGPANLVMPSKDPERKPVTVGDVIKGLGLDETKASYLDEPPGILRGLRWRGVRLPGTDVDVDVEIRFAARGPFSDKHQWDSKEVRAIRVLKVTITPAGLAD
jgi:hypothetical protein